MPYCEKKTQKKNKKKNAITSSEKRRVQLDEYTIMYGIYTFQIYEFTRYELRHHVLQIDTSKDII